MKIIAYRFAISAALATTIFASMPVCADVTGGGMQPQKQMDRQPNSAETILGFIFSPVTSVAVSSTFSTASSIADHSHCKVFREQILKGAEGYIESKGQVVAPALETLLNDLKVGGVSPELSRDELVDTIFSYVSQMDDL